MAASAATTPSVVHVPGLKFHLKKDFWCMPIPQSGERDQIEDVVKPTYKTGTLAPAEGNSILFTSIQAKY